jgi:hypothetical protein
VALLLLSSGGGFHSPQTTGSDANRRVVLGVMRSDGILIPFASFDGDDWSAPWPPAIAGQGGHIEIPVNLASIPKDWWDGEQPSEWRLWPRDSKTGTAFALVRPVTLMVGAVRRLGVQTDYPAPPPMVPPFELPYPKEGLAVGGGANVLPIVRVSVEASATQTFVERLREDLDEAEERAIRLLRSNAQWTHPLKRGVRSKVVPRLEAWYTTPLTEPGATASYIEAVKKYPPQPEDDGCGLETFVSGWVHERERDDRPKTDVKATVTYCDRETASYMLPFGQLQLRNRIHWVFQMSGQDHEWYSVVELTPGRARYQVEYFAGGVPRDPRR